MLTPSWPAAVRLPRPAHSAAVRRGVATAERRAVRRSVALGAGLLAVGLLANPALHITLGTEDAARALSWHLVAGLVAGLAALIARLRAIRGEPLALVVLVTALGAALLNVWALPTARILTTAQIAILIVAIGLFMPWSRRWQLAAMALTAAMTAAFLASPLAGSLPESRAANLAVAVLTAATVSFIGHSTWQRRLRALLAQQFALRELSRYARRQEARVSELNRELNRVARRDALTGVGNRLALDEALAAHLEQGDRLRPLRFALVLFDIDHFKAYNDEHGHLAGDAALGWLGELLRRVTRGEDRAFRYGGEEFLILLPDVDLTDAIAMAERVRTAVAEDRSGGLPPFTISGGVALCDPADGRNPEPLLRRADTALYLAKRAGRNRVAADELSAAMQRQQIATA